LKNFNHTRPVRDSAGEIVSQKSAPCSRVTFAPLGGQFGSDKRKRLVVTLIAGDVIQMRPEKTRRVVSMLAVDVYRILLRNEANKATLEKARAKKIRKQEQRESARIKRADAKLRAELRAEREAQP
jgi:hypothetical protein